MLLLAKRLPLELQRKRIWPPLKKCNSCDYEIILMQYTQLLLHEPKFSAYRTVQKRTFRQIFWQNEHFLGVPVYSTVRYGTLKVRLVRKSMRVLYISGMKKITLVPIDSGIMAATRGVKMMTKSLLLFLRNFETLRLSRIFNIIPSHAWKKKRFSFRENNFLQCIL